MEELKDLEENVSEEIVEVTAEPEEPKTYTEAEFNAKLDEVLGKKIARKEAKIRKEFERKYNRLEEVLKAGTGKDNVEDITSTFEEFYEKKGIQVKPKFSDRDIEVLAREEAKEIISGGYEDVVEEVDRLARIGHENMTTRDRVMFRTLAEHRQQMERGQAYTKLGVPESVYTSKEFQDFAAMFNPGTPADKIYALYDRETKPRKEIKPMGSMKNVQEQKVKDYYSPAEIDKLSEEDLVKDHKLWDAVRRSMTGK